MIFYKFERSSHYQMCDRREGLRKHGIVFDLDGTLIESTIDFGLMRDRVFIYLIEIGFGSVLERSDTIAKNMDRVRPEIHRLNLDLDAIEARVEAICVDVEMMSVYRTKEVPGAGDALKKLREIGYPLALLTRGSRNYATEALRASQLTGMLDAIICRDDSDVSEAKPHPEAMRRAAAALNLRPEQCVLIGDHMMDLECARAAGSMFVAVLSGHNGRKGWVDLGVERIIPSIAQLPGYLEEMR
jgi:HAD superfamily hydrolase (TIGR01549 family)